MEPFSLSSARVVEAPRCLHPQHRRIFTFTCILLLAKRLITSSRLSSKVVSCFWAFRTIATFEKLTQLTWNQVYKDKGLRWEKIHSIQAPQGIDALYSFRVSKSIRGIGFRQNHFLRVLLIEPDHDAAYGKK